MESLDFDFHIDPPLAPPWGSLAAEVPVERVVERVVQIPQCIRTEVPIERIVERLVTVPVERRVEHGPPLPPQPP